jgi:hypothetical protein
MLGHLYESPHEETFAAFRPRSYLNTVRDVIGQTTSTATPGTPIAPDEHLTKVIQTVGTDPESEAAVVDIVRKAYERWAPLPALPLRIGRIEAYALVMAMQGMCSHPAAPPNMVAIWQLLGHQLQHFLSDDEEIAAVMEAGWHRDLYVPAAKTEEQAPAPVATVTRDSGGIPPQPGTTADTIDVTAPYCYRIDQTDRTENRPDEDFMISWGSAKKSPHWSIKNALDVATYQAAVSRIEHNYLGPLRVSVWQQRPDEHYRQDPPEDAFLLELGERDDLSMAHTLVAGINQDS